MMSQRRVPLGAVKSTRFKKHWAGGLSHRRGFPQRLKGTWTSRAGRGETLGCGTWECECRSGFTRGRLTSGICGQDSTWALTMGVSCKKREVFGKECPDHSVGGDTGPHHFPDLFLPELGTRLELCRSRLREEMCLDPFWGLWRHL